MDYATVMNVIRENVKNTGQCSIVGSAAELGRPLTPNQYFGRVCRKHPQLKGLRCKPSYRCTKCLSDYQTQRMRLKRAAEKAAR